MTKKTNWTPPKHKPISPEEAKKIAERYWLQSGQITKKGVPLWIRSPK